MQHSQRHLNSDTSIKMTMTRLVVVLISLASTQLTSGFVVRPAVPRGNSVARPNVVLAPNQVKRAPSQQRKQVVRYMYNLPPPKKDDNGLGDLATSALGLIGLVAFFVSPLGGIFFALFNSLVAFLFLAPVVGLVGFQGWKFFNTIDGPCPNCGAPCTVLKDDSPSICLSCGTLVRSSVDKKSIEFSGSGMDVTNDSQNDIMSGFFDQFAGVSRSPPSPEEKKSTYRRETTIIDVEIEDK